MAKMKPKSVGKQAQLLANLWGRLFGNVDYGRTLGEMKFLLTGNKEKGLPAYQYHQVKGCIEWLAKAQADGELVKDVQGAGVIRWVIQDYLQGKPMGETWLCYRKPERFIAMLEGDEVS